MTMMEAVYVWGQGTHEKSLYFPLSFAVNLKLLLESDKYSKVFY